MPHLFTVRWPIFARLEAILLTPVALMLASDIMPVRTFVDRTLSPALSPFGVPLGVPKPAIVWAALAIVVIVPYLILMIVADRFLTIRKGFALLSIVAISAWAAAALRWSDQLAHFLPSGMLIGHSSLAFNQEAALGAGCMAFLLHVRPLWIGLRDHGEVALRVIASRDRRKHRRNPVNETQRARDVYFRQTADFRGWQPQQQLEGLGRGPKESTTVKVLSAITWFGLVAGVGAAYYNLNNLAGPGSEASKHGPAPEVPANRLVAGPAPNAGTPGSAAGFPLSPPAAAPNMHAIAGPLPAIQRPSEAMAGLPTESAASGPNEAVAERGNDGSFAFDAVVNGTHVPMLFDTGASVVALRAEDAVRAGIVMTRLNYSAKVKTANGTALVAPVIIDTLTIGNITQRSVHGFVAKEGSLQMNLLGQTFLARLSGFNVEKNLLVLKGR